MKDEIKHAFAIGETGHSEPDKKQQIIVDKMSVFSFKYYNLHK